MRELTVRIKFTRPCLGNVKRKDTRFYLPRSPGGLVVFLASWQHANLRTAAQILGRHQEVVSSILWDVEVDGSVLKDCWHKRYVNKASAAATGAAPTARGRQRFVLHEAFFPGQTVGINCAVPTAISDEDFWQLMRIAGQYKGISPWKPGEFGLFSVDSLRPRRLQAS